MTTVRLKLKCVEKRQRAEACGITFQPVVGGSDENAAFYKWTPSGEISFNTINQGAADAFAVGGEYFVDITPAG